MQEQVHIHGLDVFQDHDLSTLTDDTPPDAILVKFEVVSEYMPFLSEQAGKRIYKNFVHLKYMKDLGRTSGTFRLRDELEFDEVSGKWKILKLAPAHESFIKQFPREWNAFYNGTSSNIEGTPIDFLFRHDPTRAEMYKRSYIETIERLAALTEGDCQLGGMGWIDDKKRAMAYLARVKDGESTVQLNAQIAQVTEENSHLREKLDELTAQVTRLLQSQIDEANKNEVPLKASKSKGRPKKSKEFEIELEGL